MKNDLFYPESNSPTHFHRYEFSPAVGDLPRDYVTPDFWHQFPVHLQMALPVITRYAENTVYAKTRSDRMDQTLRDLGYRFEVHACKVQAPQIWHASNSITQHVVRAQAKDWHPEADPILHYAHVMQEIVIIVGVDLARGITLGKEPETLYLTNTEMAAYTLYGSRYIRFMHVCRADETTFAYWA